MTFLPRVSRFSIAAVALIAALGLGAHAANAGPLAPRVYGGWYTESDAAFVGVGADIGAATINVTPNFEWIFVDSGSAYSFNLDGTLNVLPLGIATGYAGAGIGFLTVDPDKGDSKTDTVANLIVGASFNATKLKPFGQFKWIVVDGNDPLVFSLGVHF